MTASREALFERIAKELDYGFDGEMKIGAPDFT